jgi:hypothetical protein
MPQTFAHNDPGACDTNGANTDIVLKNENGTVVTTAIQGSMVHVEIEIDKGGDGGMDHCALDGGNGTVGTVSVLDSLMIKNVTLGSNITLPNGTSQLFPFGCIGGTTDEGDNIGPADCGSAINQTLINMPYQVTCDDAFGETDILPFGASTNGLYHDAVAGDENVTDVPVINSPFLKNDNINIACEVVEYSVRTLSNVTSNVTSGVNPSDTVYINGTNGVEGIWEIDAELTQPDGPNLAATCNGGANVTSSGPFEVSVTCELDDAPANLTDPGQYCWDVTVTEHQNYYGDQGDDTYLGSDDADNECFFILPSWNATTLSNVTGAQGAPVINPLDTVTIVADGNFTGTFTGNFTLGNGTDVFDSDSCTGGVVNATTGIATLECEASATVDAIDGITCFDVTVNAPSPYTPSIFTLFGADDSDNECFDVQDQPEWNATTLSSVTGIVGIFSDVEDLVTINGVNGTFGNFTGNATLTFNSTAFETTDCSYVNGTEYPLEMECSVEAEFTEHGQYCWDVTITEITGNYTPSVLTLFGIDDAENECFEVFHGLTPGFWKNNAEKFEAGAWFIQNTTDSFNDVFSTNVTLNLAKGKLKDPSLDRGDPEDPTLYGALGARGGDENALARHCVAAKLNVENPDVIYPWNYTEVIDACGTALNSGNSTEINDLKDMLDTWNNFGANISQHWPN